MRSYIVAAVLAAAYMVVTVIATTGLATPAAAGMRQDLAGCTAAEGRASAAACTRVMNSGRLPDEQLYIGYFNRGSSYKRAGDFDKAFADFDRVVKLKPKFARGYHMRGLVAGELGRTQAARADLDKAIALAPKEARYYLARGGLRRSDKDYEGALADIATAGDLDSKDQKPPLYRTLVLSDMGRIGEARAEINQIISAGKAGADAYYVRAVIAFNDGRLDAAEDDLNYALKERKSFAAAHALMGRIGEARKDMASARTEYRKSIDAADADFDAQAGQRTARTRLEALGEKASPKSDVALVEPAREVGCRRFLPATGTTIIAPCEK